MYLNGRNHDAHLVGLSNRPERLQNKDHRNVMARMVRRFAETELDTSARHHWNYLAVAVPDHSRDVYVGFFPDGEREAPLEYRRSFRDQPHRIHHAPLGHGGHLASFQMDRTPADPLSNLGLDR